MTTVLASLAVGLLLPHALNPTVAPHRAAGIVLCAPDGDASVAVKAAAARVVEAARVFGGEQAEAAAAWVDEAMALGAKASGSDALMNKQMDLFEECLIEDQSKCEELDAALGNLEMKLLKGEGVSKYKLDRACARVRRAAGAYGPEQRKAADVWLAGARAEGGADPAMLLGAQVEIFGECLIDYGDDDGAACQELQRAIDALQASVGVCGSVVSTAGLLPKLAKEPSAANAPGTDEGPPPPDGFEWGVDL